MKVSKIIKFHGNINRIVEMDNAGVGANAIAGVFQDNGIDINASDVRSFLKGVNNLTQKSLPKSESQKMIDNNQWGDVQTA